MAALGPHGELFEKLRARRSVVDGEGCTFESCPTLRGENKGDRPVTPRPVPRRSIGDSTGKTSQGSGVEDFRHITLRPTARRSLGGESGRGSLGSESGRRSLDGDNVIEAHTDTNADFRKIIALRKMAVDGSAATFENMPSPPLTDFAHVILPPSPVRSRRCLHTNTSSPGTELQSMTPPRSWLWPSLVPPADVGDPDTIKLRRTVLWYNRYGNLKQPLILKYVMPALKRMGMKMALGVLWGLDSKVNEIENPTAWIVGAAANCGLLDTLEPTMDEKLSKTVSWYNKYGNLAGKLSYRMLVAPMAKLKPQCAMRILKELGDKSEEVRDPTRWVLGYVSTMQKERAIKRTARWYNQHGELNQPLHVDAIIWPLTRLELWQAMRILSDLGEKRAEVNNPTAWVNGCARKWLARKKSMWAQTKTDGGARHAEP